MCTCVLARPEIAVAVLLVMIVVARHCPFSSAAPAISEGLWHTCDVCGSPACPSRQCECRPLSCAGLGN